MIQEQHPLGKFLQPLVESQVRQFLDHMRELITKDVARMIRCGFGCVALRAAAQALVNAEALAKTDKVIELARQLSAGPD